MTLRLDTEKDPERLRQAALLLEAENRRLTARVVELTRALLSAKGEDAQALQLRLAELERQLVQKNAELFGPSSEKRPRAASAKAEDAPAQQRGHGPREQKALAIEEVVHHLDEADKTCTSCGGALQEWTGQSEDADEVDVIERRFVVRRHRRLKYRCACGGCVETAPGPEKLQEGGRYAIDFAIGVAVDKYLDHAPLERQVRAMARDGLVVDSQTLWDQIAALARHLEGAYEALHLHVLLSRVLGADETRWPLLGAPGQTKWHAWALQTAEAVVYRIVEGRGTDAARSVLQGYRGTLMTDGYAVYTALAAESRGAIALAHCWTHVRRRFVEAQDARAEVALGLIGELYAIEREAKTGPPDPGRLLHLRQTKSKDVLHRLHTWAMEVRALPESALGRALAYMGGLWPGLTRFVDDAAIPLDNNGTERALRGPVVGRKNHYGSKSRRGTEVAALFYSLCESAKLAGVDPRAYLRAATLAALRGEGALLPHTYAAAVNAAASANRPAA